MIVYLAYPSATVFSFLVVLYTSKLKTAHEVLIGLGDLCEFLDFLYYPVPISYDGVHKITSSRRLRLYFVRVLKVTGLNGVHSVLS